MENLNYKNDLIWQVKHLHKLIKNDFNERLAKFGLTAEQGRVIYYLFCQKNNNVETHQVDIEMTFHLSKSTVSELIGRMIKNELITKICDGTKNRLELTEKSLDIINHVKKDRDITLQKLFTGFSESEKEKITTNINHLIQNMEKEDK